MVKTMEELVKGSSLVTTFTIPERAPRVHTNCWPPHPGGAGTATACCGAFVNNSGLGRIRVCNNSCRGSSVLNENEPGKGTRLIPWVEKGSDRRQIAGGDHSFGAHLTSTMFQIRHHTRSRASLRNSIVEPTRGVAVSYTHLTLPTIYSV